MRPVLIADIGATNCRFAFAGEDGRPEQMVKLRGDVVASLQDGIARYLEETNARPRAAVIAVAAPVEGDAVEMTNRPWRFSLRELATRFGWTAVEAMNDFEAVALGVARLLPNDTRPLGPALPAHGGPRVVFGPGTGLGVAGLVPAGGGWRVVATEGGHVSFGAASDDEEPIFGRLRADCGLVSAERVLSGPGLERLHRAMHVGDAKKAAEITAAAHAGDARASETVRMFVRLFGRFAGDLALMFRATGGVYIGGGVARRIGTFLDAPQFREAFENHPPYEAMLRGIATTLITYDEPGLLGCAAVAEKLAASA